MDMVERVVKAIDDELSGRVGKGASSYSSQAMDGLSAGRNLEGCFNIVAVARAAIAAMRAPTEGMIVEMSYHTNTWFSQDESDYPVLTEFWQAGIDAALGEG